MNEYLLLLGIYDAIPASWKNILKSAEAAFTQQTTDTLDLEHNLYVDGESVNLEQLTTKILSWIFVNNIQVRPSAQQKYNNLFDELTLDWKQIYLIPRKATLDTKTRTFQYKLLNRIVYTNKSLFKMKLVYFPLCTFCELSEESLEHFYCCCSFSKDFWMSVASWLNSIGMNLKPLNESRIVFGLLCMRTHLLALLLNHIVILGRQVIYQSLLSLKIVQKIEWNIAIRNSRHNIHSKK